MIVNRFISSGISSSAFKLGRITSVLKKEIIGKDNYRSVFDTEFSEEFIGPGYNKLIGKIPH